MTDQNIYEIAKSKVEYLRHNIALRREQIAELVEHDKELRRQLDAWETILEAENPDNLAQPAVRIGGLGMILGDNLEQSNDGYGFKASVVRAVLQAAKERGIVPKELKEELLRAGLAVSPSFAGNALFRMKANGEVTEKDGRYFWVEKSVVTGGTIKRIS